jgi:hypothetical protein
MVASHVFNNGPVFLIGMDRSGTSAISEAVSLHESLGWISNYVHKWPDWPQLALLNHVTSLPGLGWYLRGMKKQSKGLAATFRKYLPYAAEGDYRLWERLCGEKFLWDFMSGLTATEDEQRRTRDYFNSILKYLVKKRLFVKLTGPPRIQYLDSIFPDAQFVHVVRDPRAVVSSLMQVSYWAEQGGLEKPFWTGLWAEDIAAWEKADRSPIALAAVQWRRVVEQTWLEKGRLPEKRYIELRYEDFVEGPGISINAIFAKLDLPPSPNAEKYLTYLGKPRNMNFKYKKHLKPEEIGLVEDLTRSTARQAGYEF